MNEYINPKDRWMTVAGGIMFVICLAASLILMVVSSGG